jgi:hypothetical protein
MTARGRLLPHVPIQTGRWGDVTRAVARFVQFVLIAMGGALRNKILEAGHVQSIYAKRERRRSKDFNELPLSFGYYDHFPHESCR